MREIDEVNEIRGDIALTLSWPDPTITGRQFLDLTRLFLENLQQKFPEYG